ncbi:MAG: hypothetical protein LUH09_07470 [Clostridiales bacterium]|nr:hypothetical protein [Clostridiales bacterium]
MIRPDVSGGEEDSFPFPFCPAFLGRKKCSLKFKKFPDKTIDIGKMMNYNKHTNKYRFDDMAGFARQIDPAVAGVDVTTDARAWSKLNRLG